jgi:hypothetical protein
LTKRQAQANPPLFFLRRQCGSGSRPDSCIHSTRETYSCALHVLSGNHGPIRELGLAMYDAGVIM